MEFGSPTKAEMAWAAVKTGNHRKVRKRCLWAIGDDCILRLTALKMCAGAVNLCAPFHACLCLVQLLAHALHRTVRSSSLWQAASGLLAAGGGKTVEYVGAKVMKVLRQGSQRVTAISKQSTSVWSSPGKKG
jgi:hypothetical protein